MKKTYIIPETLVADCVDNIMLGVSQKGAQSGKTTYTVDGVDQEYDSDGY